MMKQWDISMLGTVASNYDVETDLGKSRSVFVNSQNTVQFWIKRISKAPKSFPNQYYFTGYATELEKFGFHDDLRKSDYMREEDVRNFLENYLFVFTPIRKQTASGEVFLARDIELLRKADTFQNRDIFASIPVYSHEKHGYSMEEFFQRIEAKKHVGKIPKISTESNDTPEFVFWKESEEIVYVIGSFSGHSHAHGGFCFHYQEKLKVQVLPEMWLDDMYEASATLFFMNIHMYDSLRALLSGTEPFEAAIAEVAATASQMDRIEEKAEEEAFLQHFIRVTKAEGLLYAEKDLVNFHTAMKVSNLVILQGMSGIGKSRLVHAYAKALGIHNEHQMLFIPVRPAWTDDTHVMGYTDLLNNVYRAGDSGLVDLLIDASKHKDKLYVVAFDEMNLARVEHYFSQFLSVLEMGRENKAIRLYHEKLKTTLHNAEQYPPTVPIGDNVMFVGTVNVDESTYHFSDKVLDRANVITLNIMKYALLQEDGLIETTPISYETYTSFRQPTGFELSDAEIDLLWDIHEAMHKADARTGIGPRVVRQINAYLQLLPHTGSMTREEALDLQIVQRVLTKIRGAEEVWRPLVGTYEKEKGDVVAGELLTLFEKYKHLSTFVHTIALLKQKAKELKLHGYTY
ncbi:AAA family ATPase [Ectobacillus sp. JY-23]|uniref:McrB family protein n=1 Tax=Ectobacillus sp. JY-23 TaxID=2933872 RepID=UPI001FF4086B|nr:AAA family ATPase [Ectobacillus sp. JY-23]UOY91666.1 AAA family ATPase [Ectobacillus sp. JY-23]